MSRLLLTLFRKVPTKGTPTFADSRSANHGLSPLNSTSASPRADHSPTIRIPQVVQIIAVGEFTWSMDGLTSHAEVATLGIDLDAITAPDKGDTHIW